MENFGLPGMFAEEHPDGETVKVLAHILKNILSNILRR